MTPQADSGSVEGLKACPFDGASGDEVSIYHDGGEFFVRCHVCGVEGSCQPTRERSIAAWNRRAEPTPPHPVEGGWRPDRSTLVKLIGEHTFAADAAAAILALPSSIGWRTIESAPKDGTAILIWRPTEYPTEEGHHVVRWDDDWWQVHDGKFDHPLRGPNPAEWSPLPSPPEAAR